MTTMQQANALLSRALTELRGEVKDIGGCDHSVGICCCVVIRLCEDIEDHLRRPIEALTIDRESQAQQAANRFASPEDREDFDLRR